MEVNASRQAFKNSIWSLHSTPPLKCEKWGQSILCSSFVIEMIRSARVPVYCFLRVNLCSQPIANSPPERKQPEISPDHPDISFDLWLRFGLFVTSIVVVNGAHRTTDCRLLFTCYRAWSNWLFRPMTINCRPKCVGESERSSALAQSTQLSPHSLMKDENVRTSR